MSDKKSNKKVGMGVKKIPGVNGWVREFPSIEERDWYVISEAAEILLERGIIHRANTQNRYGEGKVTGVQQVRKYIRNGELAATLYKNSKKYGYIIDKKELERFCLEKIKELKERYREDIRNIFND
jgi:hypothetical protein